VHASDVRSSADVSAQPVASLASLIAPSEAAEVLGVSPATVRRWLAEGQLEGVRIGGRLRVAPEALEILIRPAGPARDELR
jgi:excisionase family DNA binding protein